MKSLFAEVTDRSAGASPPVAAPTAQAAPRRRISRVTHWLIPMIAIAAIIGIWQIVVVSLGLKPYFIPSPSRVVETFVDNGRTIWDAAVPTIEQAMTGFAIGNLLAVALSVWFVHARSARRAVYPLAIVLQSIPLVALAPIAIVTIGTGFATKVVMTAIISFFPTLVNMMRGLDSVDLSLVELFQSVHAKRSAVLWKLRWPNALPYLFAGLRITASASVIGAVIVEWIGGDQGLGYMVINSTYQFNTPLLWASLVASSLLVLAAFGFVSLAERVIVPWNRSSAAGDA
ncbi:MAG: ABC transporter permease [Actinomycetota bacterium]|nr:ABC transporter permease [Actinomycetota bacterium]